MYVSTYILKNCQQYSYVFQNSYRLGVVNKNLKITAGR